MKERRRNKRKEKKRLEGERTGENHVDGSGQAVCISSSVQ